jgi:hypothetical protein
VGETSETMTDSDDVIAAVGESYLSTESTPDDALVIAAYEHLQVETDRLFRCLVRSNDPRSVRIVFTRCREPYESDRELIAAVRSSSVLEITTAAISLEPIHPLLGCELGGPFDRFRAIHDLIGHAKTGFGFDLLDEIAAWRTQDRRHGRLARRALATELLAVNSAIAIVGEAPDHKAMLLEPHLLQRARAHGRGCTSPARASAVAAEHRPKLLLDVAAREHHDFVVGLEPGLRMRCEQRPVANDHEQGRAGG